MSGTRIGQSVPLPANTGGEARKVVWPGLTGNVGVPSKVGGGEAGRLSAQNTVFQETLPKNAGINFVEGGIPARELFRQTAAALGLPNDPLSIVLLAFARFFSLPPKPALMASLRREILASQKDASPDEEKAALEAETLALVSSLDKGVVLPPEALRHYARFFTPKAFDDGGREDPPDREEVPNPEELRAIAEEQAEKHGLLAVLNALPGRNGQRWVVFPFSIKVNGVELRIVIRFLKRETPDAGEGERLIVDIASPKRQWHCFLRKNNGIFRADIEVFPKLSPGALKLLQKEARGFLGEGSGPLGNFGKFDQILVRNAEDIPSWAEHLCAERLPSINKEV